MCGDLILRRLCNEEHGKSLRARRGLCWAAWSRPGQRSKALQDEKYSPIPWSWIIPVSLWRFPSWKNCIWYWIHLVYGNLVSVKAIPWIRFSSLCCDFADSCSACFWCSYSCLHSCSLRAISWKKTPHPDPHNLREHAHMQSRPHDCGTLCRQASSRHTSCPHGAGTPQRRSRLWRRRRSRRRRPPSCDPSGPASCQWLASRWLSLGIVICKRFNRGARSLWLMALLPSKDWPAGWRSPPPSPRDAPCSSETAATAFGEFYPKPVAVIIVAISGINCILRIPDNWFLWFLATWTTLPCIFKLNKCKGWSSPVLQINEDNFPIPA